MVDTIRITVEHMVDGNIDEQTVILDETVKIVNSISELGFNHKQQVDIIRKCQDALLKIQSKELKSNINVFPKCCTPMKLAGNVFSEFHSVFSDHKVSVKRKKCCNKDCGFTDVPSISALFGTNCHPDLSKLQTEMACNHTYREAERIMNAQSYYIRKVNNHKHIYRVVETVGNYMSHQQNNEVPDTIAAAKELICQVDGGHLKSKEADGRSFEALTTVIYNPENVKYPIKKEEEILKGNEPPRGEILSKHCAASALDDNLQSIKRQTLAAAQKQGLTIETVVTALCDGAANCWSVVESIEGQCGVMIKILDWFHIAKRFKNITLPENLSKKLEKLKWCIWHGMVDEGMSRFTSIIEETNNTKMKDRMIKLQNYLKNNKNYLVNYSERYHSGKVISSSLAESNVENLINKRCKGKQHMKWTREGVHPLLQVRASAASNDWAVYGIDYVLKATTHIAA